MIEAIFEAICEANIQNILNSLTLSRLTCCSSLKNNFYILELSQHGMDTVFLLPEYKDTLSWENIDLI